MKVKEKFSSAEVEEKMLT